MNQGSFSLCLSFLKNGLASLFKVLAFTRIPGNAFSFWVRKNWRWSKGLPLLDNEGKENLFDYLDEGGENGPRGLAEEKESRLCQQYRLQPLRDLSTRDLYRKNLYVLDILEQAYGGIVHRRPGGPGAAVTALDVGSQDWHYVFALERWLRFGPHPDGGRETNHAPGETPRNPDPVALTGIEIDAYVRYAGFFTRRDFAETYMRQTGNPALTYSVRDFIACEGSGYAWITLFFPLVTRYQTLLWGLPLKHYAPDQMMMRASKALAPTGRLLVLCHSLAEHARILKLGKGVEALSLLKEGPAVSDLVHFHERIRDRHFSVWEKP